MRLQEHRPVEDAPILRFTQVNRHRSANAGLVTGEGSRPFLGTDGSAVRDSVTGGLISQCTHTRLANTMAMMVNARKEIHCSIKPTRAICKQTTIVISDAAPHDWDGHASIGRSQPNQSCPRRAKSPVEGEGYSCSLGRYSGTIAPTIGSRPISD